MPQGLQVFDASGALHMDIGTNMSRVLGIASTGTTAGSLTDAGFATGSWWVCIITKSATLNFSQEARVPGFSLSGNTLSWAMVAPETGSFVDCTFIYGVY